MASRLPLPPVGAGLGRCRRRRGSGGSRPNSANGSSPCLDSISHFRLSWSPRCPAPASPTTSVCVRRSATVLAPLALPTGEVFALILDGRGFEFRPRRPVLILYVRTLWWLGHY